MKKHLPTIVLIIAGALMLRSLFPKRIEVATRPRIVTQYDTVKVLDTLWREKVRKEVQHDTVFAERVVRTLPETVQVYHHNGITFVHAGKKIGDSTLVGGREISVSPDGTWISNWQVQYWTGGPLHTLDADTMPPRISFYTPGTFQSGKECGFLCKLGHYAVGGAVGYGVCKVEGIAR